MGGQLEVGFEADYSSIQRLFDHGRARRWLIHAVGETRTARNGLDKDLNTTALERLSMADQGCFRIPHRSGTSPQFYLARGYLAERRGKSSLERHECGVARGRFAVL